MASEKILDIAEVARRSGLPASTLRYYEEKKLIESLGRRGLRRLYAAEVLDLLALISLGRDAGFSLDEIAGITGVSGRVTLDRAVLLEKADELDRRIGKLAAMRDGLRHAAACQAPSHMECPTFRKLMRLSVRRNQQGHRDRPR